MWRTSNSRPPLWCVDMPIIYYDLRDSMAKIPSVNIKQNSESASETRGRLKPLDGPGMLLVVLVCTASLLQSTGSCSAAAALQQARVLAVVATEADGLGTQYGRLEHWEASYNAESSFSWYADWDVLEPFWSELVPRRNERILIPGIGNDEAMVGMYDSGWRDLCAFDYSRRGVDRARTLFGAERPIDLREADARNLPYNASTFGAALDKGTLDAIYLSGGRKPDSRMEQLRRAVDELHRVMRPGGVVLSVCAEAAEHLPDAFSDRGQWLPLRDGSIHITEDGYASNNVDATMLAWERV
jgi:SAM-dependent methyltransferase